MDPHSQADPVEKVYDARIRGVCLISTRRGDRMHLHAGCWVTAVAHRPPRLLVAFPKDFEGAAIVQEGGRFAISLVGRGGGAAAMARGLLLGRHSLDALGRRGFRLAPSGCPVPRDAIGYMDCAVVETVDLGDFLLAIGDLRAAAVLDPEAENLTVNEIQQQPLAGAVRLPLRGFDDAGGGLEAAPVQGADPAALDAVYGRRRWGLFLVSARANGREHLHVGGFVIQCSHQPPRMLVSVERTLEAAGLIRAGGRFALSLLATDQLALALAVRRGASTPAELPGWEFTRSGDEPGVLVGAVAHFQCAVEWTFNAGSDHAGFYGPVEACAWGRSQAPQLRSDEFIRALS